MNTKRFFIFLVVSMLLSFLILFGNNGSQEKQLLSPYQGPQFAPAKPGPIEVRQPDGTSLTIVLAGDERLHYTRTPDGYTLLANKARVYYYAQLSDSGDLVISNVKARNPENRTRREKRFLEKIEQHLCFSEKQIEKAKIERSGGIEGLAQVQWGGVTGRFPTTGNRKLLTILIGFQDLAFVKTQSDFNNRMNLEAESFKAYHMDNSFNQLTVTTTIVGPYTTSGNMADYGANDIWGYDINPRLMVQEAVDAAEADGVDFSQFDNDNDGYLDGLCVVHADYGEEAGADPDTIWSHHWTLGPYSRTYDGVIIDEYFTVPELAGNSGSTLIGIGVICHEFGHNLGAPDLYDTDDFLSGGYAWGAKAWDVMGTGNWNNDGFTPPHHNSYSKYKLGWHTPMVLSGGFTSVTLENSPDNDISYRIDTPTSNEYFILENRQQAGWDYYLPGHGMLIIHIDGNYIDSLTSNSVNVDPTHEGVDIEEADNIRSYATYGGDPFPGDSNNKSFTDTTTPNSKSWVDENTDKPVTNIEENMETGVITFEFGKYMHIYDISISVNKKGKNYNATAYVYIRDFDGNGVSNAMVYIEWSGVVSGTASDNTDKKDGKAKFTSPSSTSTGPFTITVTNVTHPSLPYVTEKNNKTSETAYYE